MSSLSASLSLSPAADERTHRGIDLQSLTSLSIIDDALRRRPEDVRHVRTGSGGVAQVVTAQDVIYLPDFGLQVIGARFVPDEGIVDPWNLTYCKSRAGAGSRLKVLRALFRTGTVRPLRFLDEEVCCISNVFSENFSHFHEELLKMTVLERAGFTGSYVYSNLPRFAFEFFDALDLDPRRFKRLPMEPVVFRSAVYTTQLNFNFKGLEKCPDTFFELRDRMFAAASGLSSPFGKRLWLDRGQYANGPDRGVVNSDEVDACLSESGFQRLDIGRLPVLEQVAAIREAEVIAGPHGSAFVHSMYLKPKSTVIEAFSPNFLNGYSFEICRVLEHRYKMIVAPNSPQGRYKFGMRVYVPCDQLRLALQDL